MIFLCHRLCDLYKRQKLIQNLIRIHIRILGSDFIKACIESREINWLHVQNRTIFLGIVQIRNKRIYSSFQFLASIRKEINHIRIKMIALHDGVDMRLDSARKEPAVILAGLHHHGKIGELRCTFVDIQTIEIVLDNTRYRVTGCVSIRFINLHQHIEHVADYVAAAHTGIDSSDILGFQCRILLVNIVQLFLNIWILLGIVKIVFPV